jgi:hypothetical protein
MGIWYLLQWLDNRKESNFEALKFECTNTLNNLSSIATKEHDNVEAWSPTKTSELGPVTLPKTSKHQLSLFPGPSPVGRLRNPGSGSGPIFRWDFLGASKRGSVKHQTHIWDLYHHVLY